MARSVPSKTALLERREERSLVSEGKAVLEERRDLLAREMLEKIKRCETLIERCRKNADEAGEALRAAVLRHGFDGITGFAARNTTLSEPHWLLANHAGVELLQAITEGQPVEPSALGSGFLISPELERANLAFQRLLETSLLLAAEENNLQHLTRAFRTVRRRVNALDYVILPEVEQAIREIEDGLEQMDREQMVGTLWVKRQLGEQI